MNRLDDALRLERRDAQVDQVGVEPDEGKGKGNNPGRKLAEAAREGKTIPFPELLARTEPFSGKKGTKDAKKAKGNARVITPRVLGGEEVLLASYADPRQPLMDWMRSPDNPYFARAWVNRVWSRYFGVGKLGRDQVADYARRKGMPLPEMERWLAANLSYER